jgi:integrase
MNPGLLATAVRRTEVYQAKWVDVDLDGAQWHIPKCAGST